MRYRRTGIENPNALEIPVEINPKDFAILSPLGRLDFLLGLIEQEKPEILTKFVNNLTSHYEKLSETDLVNQRGISTESLISEKEHLRDYPTLAKWNLNFFLSQLELDESISWDQTLKIPERKQLRSFLLPKYNNLLTLTKTLGRDEAISLYKTYTQRFMEDHLNDSEDKNETLEEWAKEGVKEDEENRGWFRIWGEVENGTLVIRKDSCLWDEALPEIEDRELKYLVCCYGDFFSIKGENRNFALTMEHTIAAGDPYCDVVIHDLRINNALDHPPKQFFDSLDERVS
ncbi:MAG: L-2-amino-thiazoline-4-carboxylic acid hydrolase [Candidatus Thorarchaeota archaeon]